MMSWYEIIKQQWQLGCYDDPSQLDIYVQVGWITEEQKEEIVHSTDVSPEQPAENPADIPD
ncbi:XkdX family protein [Ligilactobacillus sp. LYQ135]